MVDASKSFEVSGDGITFENGVHLSSGTAVPTHTAKQGSRYYRTNPAEWYKQADAGDGNNWVIMTEFVGPGGSKDIVTDFSDTNGTYLTTNSVSYKAMTEFEMPGGDAAGVPTMVSVVAGSSGTDKAAAVRLFNRDSGLVLAELTSFSTAARIILSLGTISNWPTADFIMEIQGKKVDSGAAVQLSSFRATYS